MTNVNLGMLIRDWIRRKKLPFLIRNQFDATPANSTWWHISKLDMRGRASIYEGKVIIYDVNPARSYTAIGDERCILEPSDPDFFEKLEKHLRIDLWK